MRAIYTTSGWLRVIGAMSVLCAGVSVNKLMRYDLDTIAGGQALPSMDKCKKCEMKLIEVFECLHREDWDPCSKDACIHDLVYYQYCADAADSEKGDCETEAGITNFGWQPNKYSAGLDCGDVYQDYQVIPNQPETKKCSKPITYKGKCFLKECKGTTYNTTQVLRAGVYCKGWVVPKL